MNNVAVFESHKFENTLMVVILNSFNMTGEQLLEKFNSDEPKDQDFSDKLEHFSFHFLNPNGEELNGENFVKLPFKKLQKFFVPGAKPMVGMLVIDSENCFWLTPDTQNQPAVRVTESAVEQFKYDLFDYYSQMLATKESTENAAE